MGLGDAMQVPSPGNVPVGGDTNRATEMKVSLLALRALTMVLLIVALALMVTDKQTESIPIKLPSTTIFLKKTATFSQITGVKFYVGALSVAIAYMFFQMLASSFTILTTGSIVGSKSRAWVTFVLDQLIAYLLVSAATTVAEVGYIARHGETKVGWNQVCSDFKHYCFVYGFSLVNAFLATVAFIPVVAASAFHLFRMYGAAPAPSK